MKFAAYMVVWHAMLTAIVYPDLNLVKALALSLLLSLCLACLDGLRAIMASQVASHIYGNLRVYRATAIALATSVTLIMGYFTYFLILAKAAQ